MKADQDAWDRFAAAALQGLLAGEAFFELNRIALADKKPPIGELCGMAAAYADQMLKERKARK